jgi:hypothetical protein
MLDTLLPTDPILLLIVVDGPYSLLPPDVKSWFGPTKDNRIKIPAPSVEQRAAFFESLVKDVKRPPNMFADSVKRRKRVLEVLPVTPPLEPKKPSAPEMAVIGPPALQACRTISIVRSTRPATPPLFATSHELV